MSKNFEQIRFGRYLLLDHLVDGGMAKICRARFLGEQANKIVAIKMIQQQYSNDPAFVQMFKDELKVTFGLIHPNIAQTYDYGEVDHILYTAMEYVDGANLKQFLDRLKKRKFVFPVEISTYIISQVCQALYYAHTFTDKLTGKSYNIIHRDISPHNVMITYDGAVKVIDFGIAKAETNSEATQAGTIKGKLSYLAPEYLDGLELDHRYDQFAVGITLWEMLCSRKLFTAPNDLAVLKQIQACKIPAPSTINPNCPKELDEIVLTALQKDRNLRFKNMDALNRALVRFLYSKFPDFNATDLSFFAKELFKEDIRKDREKLKEYGKIDIRPFLKEYEESFRKEAGGTAVDPSTVEALIVTKKDGAVELDLDADGTDLNVNFTRTTRRNDFDEKISKENAKIQKVLRQQKTRVGSRTSTRITVPDDMRKKDSSLFFKSAMAIAVIAGGLYLFQPDLFKKLTGTTTGPRKPASTSSNPLNDIPKETPTPEGTGTLYLENYKLGMKVEVNGEAKSYSPLGLDVPLNKKLYVKISKKGFADYSPEAITLTPDSRKYVMIIPQPKLRNDGYLESRGSYPEGSYLVYEESGVQKRVKLPFKNLRMPAGYYDAVIINNEMRKKKKVFIKIEANRRNYLPLP